MDKRQQRFRSQAAGFWLALFVLLLSLAFTAAVAAQTDLPDRPQPDMQPINGDPLTVSIAPDGRYQMALHQDGWIEAQSSGALYLWYDGCEVVPRTTPLLGADLASWIPREQSGVAGEGTAANPWRVTTQLYARCEQGLEVTTLTVESAVTYIDGAEYFRLNLDICGGEAGEQVETALLTQNGGSAFLRADARSQAIFDEFGCADFSILWTFGTAPQTPLSLETMRVEAGSALDLTSIIGFSLVGLIFITLLCLWWVMLPPLRKRK